jgi:hypothetical protein
MEGTSSVSHVMVGFCISIGEPSFGIILLISARNIHFSIGNSCDVYNQSAVGGVMFKPLCYKLEGLRPDEVN